MIYYFIKFTGNTRDGDIRLLISLNLWSYWVSINRRRVVVDLESTKWLLSLLAWLCIVFSTSPRYTYTKLTKARSRCPSAYVMRYSYVMCISKWCVDETIECMCCRSYFHVKASGNFSIQRNDPRSDSPDKKIRPTRLVLCEIKYVSLIFRIPSSCFIWPKVNF